MEGRIIAITYSPGGRTGSWQPWVAMGSAKAAARLAGALLRRGFGPAPYHCQRISPAVSSALQRSRGGVFACSAGKTSRRPHEPGTRRVDADENGSEPRRHRQRRALLCMDEAGFITGQIIHVDAGRPSWTPVFPLEIQQG